MPAGSSHSSFWGSSAVLWSCDERSTLQAALVGFSGIVCAHHFFLSGVSDCQSSSFTAVRMTPWPWARESLARLYGCGTEVKLYRSCTESSQKLLFRQDGRIPAGGMVTQDRIPDAETASRSDGLEPSWVPILILDSACRTTLRVSVDDRANRGE